MILTIIYNTAEKVRDSVSLSLLGAEIGVQSAPTQQGCLDLQLERGSVSNGQDPGMDSCTKLIQPTTYIRTCATKRSRGGVSNGRLLTESPEALICHPDNLPRQVCCLLGTHMYSIRARLPNMVKPFLLFYEELKEAATKEMRIIRIIE